MTDLKVTPHDHVSRPETPNGRALVLIPEYWGLVDHIRDVAGRFAAEGFVAVGVDLFDGETTDDPNVGRALSQSLDPDWAVGRIGAAVDALAAHLGTDTRSVGVIGWCMGGSLAFRCAAAELGAGAAIGFYGRPPAVDQILGSSTPVLGVFGAQDHVYPVEDIRAMGDALRAGSALHRFVIAEGPHAFFNDTRDSFHQDSAALGWELALGWFRYWLRVDPEGLLEKQDGSRGRGAS